MAHTDGELDRFSEWERRAWELRAAAYGRAITVLTGGAADALLDAAGVSAGTRILDVATGPGVVTLAARRRGAQVLAVDQARAMVDLARAAGVEAWRASAERLPFRGASFDAVVAGFLLNHLARPNEGVAELARVCRGRLALSVWDVPSANPVLGLFGTVASSPSRTDAVPPGPDSHALAEDGPLIALLGDAGLDDIRVDRVGWSITVEPGTWFDAVAAGTPRTGAVLAAATPDERASLRERYVEVALAEYGVGGGTVTLPAAAVVGSGRPGDGSVQV
ncbi:MAG TPA: class I SAM-dependent methyltransferase [Acidimicrobiales bacterium]|nr:class I SAM-dependent methyltransferase [Acidimicrobiales bacterium]